MWSEESENVLPVLKLESLVGTLEGDTVPFQLPRPWLTALGLPGGAENLFSEARRKKKLEASPFGKASFVPCTPL